MSSKINFCKAIRKAERRIRSGRGALFRLSRVKNKQVFIDEWYQVLCCYKAVFQLLWEARQGSPKIEAWNKDVQERRNDDELLRYLYAARNDEEHGLEDTINHTRPYTTLGRNMAGKGMSESVEVKTVDQQLTVKGNWTAAVMIEGVANLQNYSVTALDGGKVKNYVTCESIALGPVKVDHKKRQCDPNVLLPPTIHLNNTVDPNDPLGCASSAYDWLESIISEAKKFSREL